MRWWMLALLTSAAIINYLDRQSLSVAAPVIRRIFHLSNADYSVIVTAFLLGYAIFNVIAGRLIDRLGTRRGFVVAMSGWSLASMAQAAATGVASFSGIRFVLAAGEAAFLPASVKAISEWFPEKQRAFAVGVVNAGIGAGGVLAPPLIAWLILHLDWRWAFVITGISGFIWLFFWLLFPSSARSLQPPTPNPQQPRWRSFLRRREVIGLMLARVISDSAWYFYLFWLPNYLSQARGFSLQQIGAWAWIPYLSAIVGGVAAGALPAWLMHRGWSLHAARKTSLGMAAVLMPLAMSAAFVSSAAAAIAFISLATFLIQIWASNLFTLPADLFPSRIVASVFGLAGTAGSAAAMVFTLGIGQVVDRFSYTPIFVCVALMHLIALLVLHVTIPRIEKLEI